MSGYRSIKRVLGETSLERKCRLLFGGCLLLLLSGTFWSVDRVAENLVIEKTNRQARDWVKAALLQLHWEHWDIEQLATDTDRLVRKEMVADLTSDNFFARIVSTPDGIKSLSDRVRAGEPGSEQGAAPINDSVELPESDAELRILQQLETRWRERWAEQILKKNASVGADAKLLAQTPPGVDAQKLDPNNDFLAQVFHAENRPDEGRYVYYQPVAWKKSCFRCHIRTADVGLAAALSAADRPAVVNDPLPPFVVVSISSSYEATRSAIANTRAILIAVAILTVFFSMIALYVIVRYVIVKPLHHLRDVSDMISRGNSEVRADLHTGDEFEELAESFNRMLRHLIESQSNLRKVNGELDAKVDELAQLNMRLYEMNRLKSDFLANMSHELRTPLNSIIGFSEVLQGIDSLNDKQKRYAQNIQKSGRVLLEMINDILDLAKLEAGKMDVRLSEFQIDSIVGAQCDMVRSLTDEKNIDLSVHTQPDLLPVYQDQGKIQQILTNLLSNAIKFTPEGGRISVSIRQDAEGRLEMCVSDTGVGIAPQDREIIFEKFRQGSVVIGKDGLTRQYSGTGLGLSIIREICRLLGGEVSLDSEVGKGSTFKIVLPWTRPDMPRNNLDVSTGAKTEPADGPWTRPVVTSPANAMAH